MIAAIILAAGESRRMGSPKALVQVGGLTFVEHLLAATRHPRIGLRRVVLGAGAANLRDKLRLGDAEIVMNESWEKGPLSSIQAALRNLETQGAAEIEGAFICPVDHPLITTHLIADMVRAFDDTTAQIVLPRYNGRRGHPVLYRKAMFAELMAAPMDVGARAVVRAHAKEIADVPTDEEGVLLNLDNPETLARLS
ncbi:MAG TPA: nucleotidyltransferase family protein [Candidatus Acidoferrales bacterium]|nr:nucleotidyltransferase family protein [Candidatus Acidoferrales bacterium]